MTDLKQQLRQLAGSRAPDADAQRRDVFKRVISCMTAGIDVSAAFGEMVLCSATSDVVTKKMCYLYVGSHARAHPDLALLTINFLQRDCQDQDPTIRGLALRSLCSLRVPNLVEYLVTRVISHATHDRAEGPKRLRSDNHRCWCCQVVSHICHRLH